jgi:glutamine amidotransferase
LKRQEPYVAGNRPASVAAWGAGVARDGVVACRRQVGPSPYSDRSRSRALSEPATAVLSRMVLASNETKEPSAANTQPFDEGASMFVAECRLPDAEAVRRDARSALRPRRADALRGTTAEEALFQLLLERRDQVPSRSMQDTVRAVAWNALRWGGAEDYLNRDLPSTHQAPPADAAGDGAVSHAGPTLTMLWALDAGLAGCQFGADLWVVQRTEPYLCPHCGTRHAATTASDYRAIVIASEPLTDEDWHPIPDGSTFGITADAHLDVSAFG